MTIADQIAQLIRCADCSFCRQCREVNPATGRYILKVRCAKGHWKKGRKNGDCDLHRVLSRRTHKCKDYASMSHSGEDRKLFLQTLAATLPLERVMYEADGEPVDILEVTAWQSEQ